MKAEIITDSKSLKLFEDFKEEVYKGNKYYRGTEKSIEKMLVYKKSAFHQHADVKPFIIRKNDKVVARFCLINDYKQADIVQISFFEALPDLDDLFSVILEEARKHFPNSTRVLAGLNGHLNYGAGILLNCFDEAPLFGLPYNPDYYAQYFSSLDEKKMYSFKLRMKEYTSWAESYGQKRKMKGLTVRFMDKKNIQKETEIYTYLNNKAFGNHTYWADREFSEDLELFYPFRFLLDNENLVIAEYEGKPVGFFLWYPDFNQLVKSHRDLNIFDVIRFRNGKKISVFRFTEIGILPEFQGSPVGLELIQKVLPFLKRQGFEYCEGGFIFEDNKASMAFVSRLIERSFGEKPTPYRQFAVYEGKL